MQGRSFRENLKGQTPNDWRTYGYYQYWEHSQDRPGHFGIRGKRYTLAFFYGNGFAKDNDIDGEQSTRFWDFFDLKKDPHELRNAYDDPRYRDIIKAMKVEIMRQRTLLGDTDANDAIIQDIIAKHWD
jgi:hypothetical protein